MSLCVQAPAWPMAIVEKREYRSAVSASRRAPGERIREEEALVTAVEVTPSEPTGT